MGRQAQGLKHCFYTLGWSLTPLHDCSLHLLTVNVLAPAKSYDHKIDFKHISAERESNVIGHHAQCPALPYANSTRDLAGSTHHSRCRGNLLLAFRLHLYPPRDELEPIEIHDPGPRRDKILNKFLLPVIASIHFCKCAQF